MLEIPGSHRLPLNREALGPVDAEVQINAVVVLKPSTAAHEAELVSGFLNSVGEHSIRVTGFTEETNILEIQGSAEDMQVAFDTSLALYLGESGDTFRGREGGLNVPDHLHDLIDAVLGLDNRKVAHPYFHAASPDASTDSLAIADVAKAYNFPVVGKGAGKTIGIIELGGGYTLSDLQNYFASLGVLTPTIKSVPVAGGSNTPDGPNGADGEVQLDIEVAGVVASDATLNVYFGPNTDAGFLAAINAAIKDKVDVITISWGGPESSWTPQAMNSFDSAFAAAGAAGISVFVAAGDSGSNDGTSGPMADFPSSSPNVTACGGTRLVLNVDKSIEGEVVWDDNPANDATGGGYSGHFSRPDYQPASVGSQRGIPDVTGNADPVTGYQVNVDGQDMVIGGTSAVAPLYAGLAALLSTNAGKHLGPFNTLAYGAPTAFRDVTVGNNGKYRAGPGWDATSGLGSPNGMSLLAALVPAPPAPTPPPVPAPPAPTPPPTTPPPVPTPQPVAPSWWTKFIEWLESVLGL